MNAFNSYTIETYARLGLMGITLSQELTIEQISDLPDCGIMREAAVYGRQTMMVSAHCPAGAELADASGGGAPCGLCAKGGAPELVDRMGARFPVLCDPTDCRSRILNADILAVPSLVLRLAGAGVSLLRLSIYDESPGEVERLLSIFTRAPQGDETVELRGRGYTKGHYFRGVTGAGRTC